MRKNCHWIVCLWVSSVLNAFAAPVDFVNDIIPVLTKVGCNAGACHGSAAGRGGFKLSLYGSNPDRDYQSIVRELSGRRINLQHPEDSLIVLKPTLAIKHGGKFLLDDDDEGTQLLIQWIREGAELAAERNLVRVEFSPSRFVSEEISSSIPLKSVAYYSDGTSRDVSRWTVYTPEDDSAVQIDKTSPALTISRPGRHIIIARYLDQVAPIEIIIPLSQNNPKSQISTSDNFIDNEIRNLLSILGLPESAQASDATFIRRATLDLTGRLPAPARVTDYLNDPSESKKPALIERLLESDAFYQFWTYKLSRWLRIGTRPNDKEGMVTYHRWLSSQLREGIGYDDLARTLIMASGDSHKVGPANFYRTERDPRAHAEFTSELFMGSRLRCANCHNHPLDKWTQDDYHGLAAIFARVGNGQVVEINRSGEVIHPLTLEPARSRIPGEYFLDPDKIDGREDLADWLTAKDNPYFAKAVVNRIWKSLMGRGLVEPVDDFRSTNPATNPELLDMLASDFVEQDYQLKAIIKRIVLSDVYGKSADALPGNAIDDRYFSHALRRTLEAEVLADALTDVLEVPVQYGDEIPDVRAVALVDPETPSRVLDVLGRCVPGQDCEPSVTGSVPGGLTRNLHLFNGELLNDRISHPESRLMRLLQSEFTSTELIDELYLAALSRVPQGNERQFWHGKVNQVNDPNQKQKFFEDFLWSLLTSNEFITK